MTSNESLVLLYSSVLQSVFLSFGPEENVCIFRPLSFWIRIFNPVPMISACVSRDYVLRHSLRFSPVPHEDYFFWRNLLLKLPDINIFCSGCSEAFYLVRENSVSSNKLKSVFMLYLNHRSQGYSVFDCASFYLFASIPFYYQYL